MDIDLLAKMVKELIVGHDQVGLPGVGTFVAEMIPATFSDKGFTINPPYRRLSFYPSRLEDSLLIDFYADSNHITREAASTYINQYLAELKSVLLQRKSIVLPGLGRLRATRENALFFVPDEDLDIFPEGVGLGPVSLKSLATEEQEPVVIDVPAPTVEEATQEEIPDQVRNEEPEPANEETEPAKEESEAPQPQMKIRTARDGMPEQDRRPSYEDAPRWMRDDWREPEPRHRSKGVTLLVILLALIILALVAFVVLARVAPDFVDSLLYTPDELRIINY